MKCLAGKKHKKWDWSDSVKKYPRWTNQDWSWMTSPKKLYSKPISKFSFKGPDTNTNTKFHAEKEGSHKERTRVPVFWVGIIWIFWELLEFLKMWLDNRILHDLISWILSIFKGCQHHRGLWNHYFLVTMIQTRSSPTLETISISSWRTKEVSGTFCVFYLSSPRTQTLRHEWKPNKAYVC